MRIGVQYSQAPQRPLSIWEQFQVFEILTQYPALTLKVLIHRRVGLRRADPTHVLLMAGLLLIISFSITNWPLGIFALAVAVAGCWHHYRRWVELRGDKLDPWHTYSEGVSPLEDLIVARLKQGPAAPTAPRSGLSTGAGNLPNQGSTSTTGQQVQAKAAALMEHMQKPSFLEWLAGESRIYRRVEPTAVMVIGVLLYVGGFVAGAINLHNYMQSQEQTGFLGSVNRSATAVGFAFNTLPLGAWLMFSAFCLGTNERLKWRHQVQGYLDWYDGQIDSATMREWGGKGSQGRAQPAASRRQTYGLPTGIGNDIRASVERQAVMMHEQEQAQQHSARLGSAPEDTPRPSRSKAAQPPEEDVLKAPDNRTRTPADPPIAPDPPLPPEE